MTQSGQRDVAHGIDDVGTGRSDKEADRRAQIADQKLPGFTRAVDEAHLSLGVIEAEPVGISLKDVSDRQVGKAPQQTFNGGLIRLVNDGLDEHPARSVFLQNDPGFTALHFDQ